MGGHDSKRLGWKLLQNPSNEKFPFAYWGSRNGNDEENYPILCPCAIYVDSISDIVIAHENDAVAYQCISPYSLYISLLVYGQLFQ